MSTQKLGFEESLGKNVVLKEICSGCAACVLVCPFGCLEYFGEKPNLAKKCEMCGICPRVCPRFEFSKTVLEKLVFDRTRQPSEDFGIYRRMAVVQATASNVLQSCQDGGGASAFLTYAFKEGIIDSAIVSATEPERPWFPVPRLVSRSDEVPRYAGTRYTYSPNLLALHEAAKLGKRSVAFVGTPCQVQSIRKIEAFPLKKYAGIIKFTVGLMCTESFTYEGLMKKHIEGVLGISLNDVRKINIKGKVLVTTKSGETRSIPLQEAKQYTRKGCLPCDDFSAEFADISTGGLGLTGWTFTIVRTEKGEEIFKGAEETGAIRTKPAETEKFALDLLVKLTKKKRKIA